MPILSQPDNQTEQERRLLAAHRMQRLRSWLHSSQSQSNQSRSAHRNEYKGHHGRAPSSQSPLQSPQYPRDRQFRPQVPLDYGHEVYIPPSPGFFGPPPPQPNNSSIAPPPQSPQYPDRQSRPQVHGHDVYIPPSPASVYSPLPPQPNDSNTAPPPQSSQYPDRQLRPQVTPGNVYGYQPRPQVPSSHGSDAYIRPQNASPGIFIPPPPQLYSSYEHVITARSTSNAHTCVWRGVQTADQQWHSQQQGAIVVTSVNYMQSTQTFGYAYVVPQQQR